MPTIHYPENTMTEEEIEAVNKICDMLNKKFADHDKH